MRVLKLSYEFPPIGGGGAKVVYGLSKELARLEHNVDLVTMGFQKLPRYEKENGVNIYRIPCIRRKEQVCSTPEMASYIFSAVPILLKLLKQKNYLLNHAHFIFPDGLISYILKRLTGLPYIVTAHGSDVPEYNPNRFKLGHKLLFPLWREVVRNSEQIVCPSESLKSLILKHCADAKIKLISNGIDINRFRPNGSRQKSILVVSRMFERKGIQYFLKALEGLDSEYKVNIVGDGPYLKNLRQMTDKLKVKVKFWGWMQNNSPELKELYETSNIFVFPSQSENFPIVLLEAMAAGMAIITTSGTGCAEVVADTALLVEPTNTTAIREALIKLINDPTLRNGLGQAARMRLESNFSWTAVASQYADVYKTCTSARPRHRWQLWAGHMPWLQGWHYWQSRCSRGK
ncbi:MAG TPA: glycosyltransferase family 4 protein [Thermodesulfobacteriota bacterium]|nr:glycosyltransferase family 4 protein [Thermodesulfobacteriota bacterium]